MIKPTREKLTRSELMRRVRSRGTTPELLLQKALRAEGLRFQTSVDNLPGKPDIAFRAKRLAIFVDGEFWHGIQWQKRGLNRLEEQFVDNPSKDYWIAKIGRNVKRDRAATAALLDDGWTVLRFWEGDVRRNTQRCVEAVASGLEHPAFSPVALASSKTFTELAPISRKGRLALESLGWRVSAPSEAALALLPLPGRLPARTSPFVVIETSPRLVAQSEGKELARVLRLLNRRGYGVDALYAGSPRRLFIIGVYSATSAVMPESGRACRSGRLARFIAGHPKVRWNFRRLPAQGRAVGPIAWLAEHYMDPAITEILRGTPLVARRAG